MHICSDTCIWIDFLTIGALKLPFRLDFKYFMSDDAMQDELLSPVGFKAELLEMGLIPVELDDKELVLVYEFTEKYPRLSTYDSFALAITKQRNYTLLSGDGNLRLAADNEGIPVKGTLWVLDELLSKQLITLDDYKGYLTELSRFNGGIIRLPEDEIRKRLDGLKR